MLNYKIVLFEQSCLLAALFNNDKPTIFSRSSSRSSEALLRNHFPYEILMINVAFDG